MRYKRFPELDYLNSCTSYSEFIMRYNMKFGNRKLTVDEIKYILRILRVYNYIYNKNGSYSWVFDYLLKDPCFSRITTRGFRNYLCGVRASRNICTWRNSIWKTIGEIEDKKNG